MDKQDFLIIKLSEELNEICTELTLQNIKELESEISDMLTIVSLLNQDCNYNFDLTLEPSGAFYNDTTIKALLLSCLNVSKLCSKSLVFGHQHNKDRLELAFKDVSKLIGDLKLFNVISTDFKLTEEYRINKISKLNKFSPFNIVFM